MAMGAYNWRVQRPQLEKPGAEPRIVQSSQLELLLGTVLLAVTAVLVALPMPGE